MKVLITGSRNWEKTTTIYSDLNRLLRKNTRLYVLHGDCPTGADRMAHEWCVENIPQHDVREKRFPADWLRYGRRAGFLRNEIMVNQKPDLVLAYIRNQSKGATNCALLALNAGLPLIVRRESAS